MHLSATAPAHHHSQKIDQILDLGNKFVNVPRWPCRGNSSHQCAGQFTAGSTGVLEFFHAESSISIGVKQHEDRCSLWFLEACCILEFSFAELAIIVLVSKPKNRLPINEEEVIDVKIVHGVSIRALVNLNHILILTKLLCHFPHRCPRRLAAHFLDIWVLLGSFVSELVKLW